MAKIWAIITQKLLCIFFFSLLFFSMILPISAAGTNIETRIERGFEWILGQEIQYLPGSKAFIGAVSSTPEENRIYVHENVMAATAFAMYHKVYTSDKYSNQLKSTLKFIISAQTPEKDFYHFWDVKSRKWNGSGKLFYWNAHIIEGLSFTAFHMRLSTTLYSEKNFYNQIKKVAASCIEQWHENSQQPDGRWILSYPDSNDHAEIDENSMILTTLLYLALYEMYWGNPEKMQMYTDWAQETMSWILSQQETDSSFWGYGGFYDDETNTMQHSTSNARTLFGLTSYLRTITSLTNLTESEYLNVRESIYLWSDNFLLKMIDGQWGAYQYRASSGAAEYPKHVLRNAELMRTLVEIWIVLGDLKFVDYATNLYDWITGINDANTDLQQALNRKSENGGFYIGINLNGSIINQSNLETTAITTSAFIYGKWITISEFKHPLIVFLILFVVPLLFLRYAKSKKTYLL